MVAPESRGVMSTLRGEERLVTVVFADMTESVRRTSGLSAEEATGLVNPLLETMVELMIRYGGRIDRFLGDGVLAVFGVPSTHEDDPIRAVTAALALRERSVDLGLAVTVGINTGRVYFGPVGSSLHEELTVMGPTVNLAARLQSAATSGEVVIGESTAAHVRSAFELTSMVVKVKGLKEPVTAYRAERLLGHPEKVRGIEGLQAEIVGRDSELQRLQTALDEGGTFALRGAAGVGKSRVAAELRRQVAARQAMWLEGRCLELTSHLPYGPFVDLLNRWWGQADQPGALLGSLDELVRQGRLDVDRVEQIAPFLAHLLGTSLGEGRDLRVVESDAEQRRTLTISSLVELLVALGTESVVILEDLHWADPLSIETISQLHDAIADHQLLLLLIYRPETTDHLRNLRDRLRATGRFTELGLNELNREQSQQLINRLLAIRGIPPSLEGQLLDHAQGNPFYIEELIRSLIQRGTIERDNGRWRVVATDVELSLPESIEALVMSRFDRLPDTTRRASRAASVLDHTFNESLFAAVAGETITGELTSMVEAGLTRLEGDPSAREYTFVHALTRQSIYGNLLPSQRAQLHDQAGQALEAIGGADIEQLAYHFQRSRQHRKAVAYLLAAAERSLESFATESSSRYLEEALGRVAELPEVERPTWRARLRARKGELLERLARHDEARIELEAALTEMTSDPLAEARTWRLLGQTHRLQEDFEAAHISYDRAEEALGRLPEDTESRRAWIDVQKERAYALYFGGRGRELPAHNEMVRPVVGAHGTAAQRVDHLLGQMLSGFVRDRFVVSPEDVATARRALALAEGGADPGRIAEARFVLGFSLLWSDQVEEAADVLARAVDEAHRLGAVMEENRGRAYFAIALRRSGRVDDAEAAALSSLELAARLNDSYYTGHARAVLCWVDWCRGNETCTALGEDAYAAWGVLEDRGHSGVECEFAWLAAWPLAAVAMSQGDHQSALRHLGYLRVPWERPLPPDLAEVVELAFATGDESSVERSLQLARAYRFL